MVPLLRHDEAIGAISVTRREPGGFTVEEISLLQTFADQAVIAIENVRLFKELEARNRDLTATSEILLVISRSPTDTQPVFEAIAESAGQLMGAVGASVYEFDGTLIHLRTITPAAWPHAEALRRQYPRPPQLDLAAGRVILQGTVLHSADIETDPTAPPLTRQLAQQMGLKGVLWVPMLREGAPVGAIGVIRATPGLFSDEQVRLLQTFAEQAVIAIENVRLFNETKKALGRQTATAEILRVIARSPTKLQPALDAVATNAVLVCDAYDAVVFLREGGHVRYAAHYGPIPITVQRTTLSRDSVTEAAILDRQPVHVHDLLATEPPVFPLSAKAAREGGFRTCLSVPLLRENEAIGALAIRRREVHPFTTQQIELLKTFADQAVIAIENVRLFKETKDALERQEASGEILNVIASSPTDIQPVFEAIADRAMRLLAAWSSSVWRYEGDLIRLVAARGGLPGSSEVFMEQRQPGDPAHDSPASQTVLTRTVFHSIDVEADPSWGPRFRAEARMRGFRSIVAVPMLSGSGAAGVIAVTRADVGGFAPAEIALLQAFRPGGHSD